MSNFAFLHEHPVWFSPLFASRSNGFGPKVADMTAGREVERTFKVQDHPVSNRGRQANLVGAPEQLKQRITEYQASGLDLLLIQMMPKAEVTKRFAVRMMGTP